MPVSYIEDGVKYDVAGLLLTLRNMRNKEEIKTELMYHIDMAVRGNSNDENRKPLDSNATWLVDRILSLVRIAETAEQKEIYNQVSVT
jgi:hypothetical protein